MSQPSTTDFLTPFDPTGYTAISGAQLLQLVGGVFPNTGIGLIVVTTDIATVPQVPNATSVTKWQNYIWIRITATSAIPYIWNPSASDPTFLSWVTVAAASIGVGTITGAMIASNTITDSNIASVNWSKIIGAPASLPPSGAAGGDLSGSYPNPVVGNAAITGAKIAAATITGGAGGNFVAKTIQPVNDMAPSGTALAFLRTNAGATAVEWAIADILASNLAVAGNGLKVPQVNSGGTGYQLTAPNTSAFGRILQKHIESTVVAQNTATNLALTGTAPTTGNTVLATIFGAAGTITFTPLSATSTLVIRVTLQLSSSAANNPFFVLFHSTTALGAAVASIVNAAVVASTTLEYTMASPGTSAQSFEVYFAAPAGTTYINSSGATNTGVAAILTSSVVIEEYI